MWFSANEIIIDDDYDAVTKWLQFLPKPTGSIVISWDRETAVQTNWDTFVSYWDDFLYPGSDDVAVFDNNGLWLLDYNHNGILKYVTRKIG